MKLTLVAALSLVPAIFGQGLSGRWDGTVTLSGSSLTVPFQMEIATQGSTARATFFNGDEKYPATAGKFENGKLHLEFNYYTAVLEADYKDGKLTGTYVRPERGAQRIYNFEAKPHAAEKVIAGAPDINGAWELAVKSPKHETAWHFLVRQKGSHVDASILRVDGDTGTLSGNWNGASFVLSHFSGARAALMSVTPQADGSLKVTQEGLTGKTDYAALRPAVARAKGLEPPTDPLTHTSVQDLSKPFAFRFVDLNGKTISNDDPKFKDKVVLVNILGSWCPNCHDEAPFLVELYKRYRAKGLEIVALSFEEPEQVKNPEQLRAFVKRYGIEYTVLVPGAQSEINAKLPQLKDWDAWPTTFFLGRDGKVKKVHAGFPSSASGEAYTQAKADFTATVENLLNESDTKGCVIEPPTIVQQAKKPAVDCLTK